MGLLLACMVPLAYATPMQAHGPLINVEPDVDIVAQGSTVILVAEVRDDDGNPVGDVHVRWFFHPASPNDIDSDGNSPDLSCQTDASGSCSVSYIAASEGIDTLCVLTGGPTSECWDDWADPRLG